MPPQGLLPKPPRLQDESLQDLVKEVEGRELQKEERKAKREEKQRLKEAQRKQTFQEKMVAPILLLLTVIISIIVWLLS